jgi:oxalate decarboxylase/phosphoglucose isomerase-like protein (cupin superfamily)
MSAAQPMTTLKVGAEEITLRVDTARSGGALLALEVAMPPGGGPPLLHRHEPAEVYRVESGEFTMYLEDDAGEIGRLIAAPGDVVHIPAGRAHTIRNESDMDARAYVTFVPAGGFEAFARGVSELAAAGPPSPEDVVELAVRHGIEFTGPVPGELTPS